MAKGVKKIKMTEGVYYKNKSDSLSSQVTIEPDQYVSFEVLEWISGTKEEDKKKVLTWMRQTNNRKIIVAQVMSATGYKFSITKKLCGPYAFYVEASLSGERDFRNNPGIYVNGYTEPRIVKSEWRSSKNGSDIRKKPISYGDLVYLWLDTEGLNGERLTIEVYNNRSWPYDDTQVTVQKTALVKKGEVLFTIGDTNLWMAKVKNISSKEEFFIKVKDSRGNYILDNNKDDLHARFIRVKKELVSNEVKPSENITPTKVFKPEVNAKRHEPCKFDKITITIPTLKDGKIENNPIEIFKDGQTLKGNRATTEKINRTIHFKFNDSSIAPDAQKILNNILGFLLEHKGTTIYMSGYACVIGPKDNNKKLSQQRGDAVKDFFTQGGLDGKRIISKGKGEYNIQSEDDYKHRNEKVYKDARRVDISFTFAGHTANALTFETIAPSSDKLVTLDVIGLDTKDCYRDTDKHKKEIIVKSLDSKEIKETGTSVVFPIRSTLSKLNPAPINYIWPKKNALTLGDSAAVYQVHIHSCRYYSDKNKTTINIKAYPDIKWELEFKWNHTQSFAYSYGNKMHPYDIEKGKEKVIGSVIDAAWSEKHGEMAQSFELSLFAKWDNNSQKLEIGKKWGEKIAKTLKIFNKIKKAADSIVKSPVNGGKISFEIKAPVIAISAKWYLEQPKSKTLIGTNITLGIESSPLVEAEGKINLWKIFRKYGPNAICPGAGEIVEFVIKHLESNVGISFIIAFTGSINVKGQIQGNTLVPKDTKGELEIIGKIQVTAEFKAWANGNIGMAGFEGYVKADVSTFVSGGIKGEVSKEGLLGYPVLEFGGVIATYVAVGTVKFGIFKRTFKKEGKYILVEEDKVDFKKRHILGPYK